MSTSTRPTTTTSAPPAEKTFFEQQREVLMKEIAISFEHVLGNINKLNRSLEQVIAVGNEFGSVEALWSQFETVMAKDPEEVEGHIAGNSEGQHHEGGELEVQEETGLPEGRNNRR